MKESRIKYVEGSSLPHFERGDGGPMTRLEASELLNKRHLNVIANAVDGPLKEFLRHELMFRGQVGEIVAGQARKIMGADRPIGDDDAEFFGFCDMLLNRIVMEMERALDNYIDRPY